MKKIITIILLFMFSVTTQYAQWTQSGLNGQIVRTINVDGNKIFAGTDNGTYLSIDNSSSWTSLNNSPMSASTQVMAIVHNGNTMIAGTWGQGIFISVDNGTNWSCSYPNYNFSVNSLALCNDGSILIGAGGVWRSTDDGTSWAQTSDQGLINAITINGVEVFIGEGQNSGISRSTDNGVTWLDWNNALTRGRAVRSLGRCGGYIFAGFFSEGVYRTATGDSNWIAVNSGLPDNGAGGVPTITAFLTHGNNIFVGIAGSGMFLSTNYGSSWGPVNDGLTSINIRSLAIYDTLLLTGTYEGGVWFRPLPQMVTDVEKENSTPTDFALLQNYPNPFNPNTNISYHLPTQSYVTLKVFDLLGREAASLVNEVEEAGYKTVWFDANGLSSGMYYYRLKAGRNSETKKLLLLK
ncbi:MAG: T9SS type A sorting domain-containing protein [Ignavibacteriales bacterium]|nr:T9SS type A sorting domain-containing protein [Ignavibacteriales bacterium]